MDDSEATSLEQIRSFLAHCREMRFAGQRREQLNGQVERPRSDGTRRCHNVENSRNGVPPFGIDLTRTRMRHRIMDFPTEQELPQRTRRTTEAP